MKQILDNAQLLNLVEQRIYSYEPALDQNTTERLLSCLTALRQALVWAGEMCAPKELWD